MFKPCISLTARVLAGVVGMALWLAVGPPAQGIVMTNCGTAASTFGTDCSLQELLSGGSIIINNTQFDQWTPGINSAATADGFNLPDLDGVEVVPLEDTLNPGVRHIAHGQWATDGTETESNAGNPQDFDIITTFSYVVSTLDGAPLIKDNSLELLEFSFGQRSGFIRVVDDPCLSSSNCFGADLGSKAVVVDAGAGFQNLFAELQFAPQSQLFVFKQILLSANTPGSPTDVLSLDIFEQRFSHVPEPGTLGLLAVGLGVLGWLRWRRR